MNGASAAAAAVRGPPLLLLRLVQAYHALEVALDAVPLMMMMMVGGWGEGED